MFQEWQQYYRCGECCQQGVESREYGYADDCDTDLCRWGRMKWRFRMWVLVLSIVLVLMFALFGFPTLMHLYECTIH